MTAKSKGRIAPRIDLDSLQDTFAHQLASGTVYDAQLSGGKLPALQSAWEQRISVMGSVLQGVSLTDTGTAPSAERRAY
jgi:hypothetical protein